MKVLLIGHYPPPHGGISVHLYEAKRRLDHAKIKCRVLNLNRAAPRSEQYICFRSVPQFLWVLLVHAWDGWTLHLHTNGHNRKSWLLAFFCGIAGQFAPACLLTVHSGMAPGYLSTRYTRRRRMVRISCLLYNRVICVNRQIHDTFTSLGLPTSRLQIRSAYLSSTPTAELPAEWKDLVQASTPLLTTVLFFRPEYGFDVLLSAIVHLHSVYPELGCMVIGSGDGRNEAERMIREAGMENVVRLLGDVPHDLCLGLIAASDLFVRPTYTDGDSLSVREALSLGVPAVVSDVGNRPPGTFLFRAGNPNDLASKVETVLASSRGARTVATEYRANPAKIRQLLDIYNQTAAQGAQP